LAWQAEKLWNTDIQAHYKPLFWHSPQNLSLDSCDQNFSFTRW
jgi:hypothetical protein